MTERRSPRPPAVHEEDVMHLFAVDTAFALDSDRRRHLLARAERRRVLRRRPVATSLPGTPPDAA